MTPSSHDSFSARHRWSGWVNLVFATTAVFLLAIVLNYFSHRHYTRAWWAGSRDRELSPRTQQLLDQITNEVKVIIFYDRGETVYPMVQNMLQQYVHRNHNLKLSSVDPMKQPKDAARIFGELDINTLLKVAERMKEKKLAPIMAKMNPDRAKEMTVALTKLRNLPLPGT